MSMAAQNPAFFAYAVSSVVLSFNMFVLWNMSGGVRGKTGTTANPEDAAAFKRNVAEADPPEVARVLRAHRNSTDNSVPFMILGLIFTMLGPGALEAQILFYGFAAARVLYSFFYLKAIQPWRTASYALGVLLTLALMVEILRLLFTA